MSIFATKNPRLEQIEQIQTNIDKINREVPEEVLQECEWIYPLKGNTQVDLAETDKINIKRQEECYYLNNAKIDFIKTYIRHTDD